MTGEKSRRARALLGTGLTNTEISRLVGCSRQLVEQLTPEGRLYKRRKERVRYRDLRGGEIRETKCGKCGEIGHNRRTCEK